MRERTLVRVSAFTAGPVEQRAAALRRHAEQTKLPWQRAAENLLIESGWIGRDPFYTRAVVHIGDEAMVLWGRAAEVLTELSATDAVAADELVALAFAVALGTDRYALAGRNDEHQRLMLAAVAGVVREWTTA